MGIDGEERGHCLSLGVFVRGEEPLHRVTSRPSEERVAMEMENGR